MTRTFWRRAFVIRWRGWRQAVRDFAAIEFGFLLFGFAIDMMIKAELGAAPWVALETGLARWLPLTLGQTIIAMSAVIILLDVLLRQPLGWGTLANMLSIGVWVDWLQPLTPAPLPTLWVQIPYLLLAVLLLGLGSAIYVGVHAGAGPRDSLMLVVSRRLKISLRLARLGVDVTVVLLALLLGGSVGLGTVLIALTSGSAVQAAFKLLRIQPHAPAPEAARPPA